MKLFLQAFSILIFILLNTASCKNDKAIPIGDTTHVTQEESFQSYGLAEAQNTINLNGKIDGSEWSNADWRPMDQAWIGGAYAEEDFSGRYKVLWDKDYLYVLAEIKDDKLVDTHKDGLDKYWDDDCLEVFIDADGSKGNHQYNYNAFAYHIALDGQVTDIGVDSVPHYYNNHVTSARIMNGQKNTWELSIRLYDDTFKFGGDNTPMILSKGHELGFAIAYCDNDHSVEREHFIGSIAVEGEDKNRGWIDAGIFEEVVLK